jgi:hypothetical protein
MERKMNTQEIEIKKDTIKDFIYKQYVKHNNKISIVSEYSDSNPNMESQNMNHYKVTLKRKYPIKEDYLGIQYAYKRMTLNFSQGYGISGEPTLEGVLECLRSDYSCANDGFDDFCGNCGYENDSIKALKTFKTIKNQSKKLKTFLNGTLDKFLECEQ